MGYLRLGWQVGNPLPPLSHGGSGHLHDSVILCTYFLGMLSCLPELGSSLVLFLDFSAGSQGALSSSYYSSGSRASVGVNGMGGGMTGASALSGGWGVWLVSPIHYPLCPTFFFLMEKKWNFSVQFVSPSICDWCFWQLACSKTSGSVYFEQLS